MKRVCSLGDRPLRGNTSFRAPKMWVTEYLRFWRDICASEHRSFGNRSDCRGHLANQILSSNVKQEYGGSY